MKDLLTQASEIAELADLDLFQPIFDELTTWRPEHEAECAHCQASLEAHLRQLYLRHQVSPRWVAHMLRHILAEADDS